MVSLILEARLGEQHIKSSVRSQTGLRARPELPHQAAFPVRGLGCGAVLASHPNAAEDLANDRGIPQGGSAMNAHIRPHDLIETQLKVSLLRGILRAVVAIFSSPKGDQGGWEAGARGL